MNAREVLYNEIDPYAAEWIRNVAGAGLISAGRVEERSIKDLTPADLAGVRRAHFFAGIGVWDYALRLAGVPEWLNIWTGSCPCQPYSVAGLKGGEDDPRHLWPDWFKLIRACHPDVILGEQVASAAVCGKSGKPKPSERAVVEVEGAARGAWVDTVRADLEGAGYAVGFSVLSVAGAGAPHKRARLFFCAYSNEFARGQGREVFGRRDPRSDAAPRPGSRSGCSARASFTDTDSDRRSEQRSTQLRPESEAPQRDDADGRGSTGGGPDTEGGGRTGGSRRPGGEGAGRAAEPDRHGEALDGGDSRRTGAGRDRRAVSHSEAEGEGQRGEPRPLGDAARAASATVNGHEPEREGLEGLAGDVNNWRGSGWLDPESARSAAEAGATRGFWGGCDWYFCRDGVYRPIEPGLFPLVDGAPSRVGPTGALETQPRSGRLKGYGNAIAAPIATEFIRSVMEIIL